MNLTSTPLIFPHQKISQYHLVNCRLFNILTIHPSYKFSSPLFQISLLFLECSGVLQHKSSVLSPLAYRPRFEHQHIYPVPEKIKHVNFFEKVLNKHWPSWTPCYQKHILSLLEPLIPLFSHWGPNTALDILPHSTQTEATVKVQGICMEEHIVNTSTWMYTVL